MPTLKIEQPFIFTIFGASGDLAKLKIFPALYTLLEHKLMPKEFYILGYARTKKTEKEFRAEFEASVRKAIKKKDLNEAILKKIVSHVHYFAGSYSDRNDFLRMNKYLDEVTGRKCHKRLAYFAVPPFVFQDIVKNLGLTKRSKREDLRLILEKPFGEDLVSAKELFHFVSRYFDEDSVFLLDHYLGKGAVKSILNLRHSNRFINLMMKGPEVANIQLTAAEDLGIETRAGYFDEVGTLKDMIQSHLLQIIAMLTMSIPISYSYKSLHREKYNIMSSMQFPRSARNVVLGQFESYRNVDGVKKNSKTETFAALRLFIDRESWYKVPIYLRTGKKLKKKQTYAVIELKKFAFQSKEEEPNRLIIEFQPDEKISLCLLNRYGHQSEYETITTSQSIACRGRLCLPEHSSLILDVINDQRINFLSFPEILASWKVTDAIVRCTRKGDDSLHMYKNGSQGPDAQHDLVKMDGFKWFDIP